jgi:hypothetical protein
MEFKVDVITMSAEELAQMPDDEFMRFTAVSTMQDLRIRSLKATVEKHDPTGKWEQLFDKLDDLDMNGIDKLLFLEFIQMKLNEMPPSERDKFWQRKAKLFRF